MSGQVYTTTVAASDNGAFSLSLPWLSGDELFISLQESTPNPVTVGPVSIGTVPALSFGNVTARFLFGTPVKALAVDGGLAVAGDNSGKLRIFDVSNPENLVPLGELNTGASINRIRLANNVAYVVYDNKSYIAFDIVDLSNPAHPVIAQTAYDSYSIGSYCVDTLDDYSFPAPTNEYFTNPYYSLYVSGGEDYIAMYLAAPVFEWVSPVGVLLIPVKTYPVWSPWNLGGWGKFVDILVDNDSGYLFAMTESTLLVLDPFRGDIFSEEWHEVGSVDISLMGTAKRLKLGNGSAYIATQTGLGIVSLARLGTPDFGSDSDGDGRPDDIIGSHETRGPTYDMAIANGMAYVTDKDNGGITVIDISNPAKPAELGVIKLDGEPLTVKAVGNMLYVGDSKGVSVIETDNR